MSYYKDQLIEWLGDKSVDADKVLSIGNLNDDRKYFKEFNANEITTLDNDRSLKPNIVLDMNEDADEESVYKERFDHLFTFELWEYLYDPMTALSNCNFYLKKDGLLWISAPFIYPTHNPIQDDYLRYTERFWQKSLPLHGFKIIEYRKREWKDSSGFLASVSTDRMRPSRDYGNHNLTGHLIIAEKISDDET